MNRSRLISCLDNDPIARLLPGARRKHMLLFVSNLPAQTRSFCSAMFFFSARSFHPLSLSTPCPLPRLVSFRSEFIRYNARPIARFHSGGPCRLLNLLLRIIKSEETAFCTFDMLFVQIRAFSFFPVALRILFQKCRSEQQRRYRNMIQYRNSGHGERGQGYELQNS